ncbi:NAD(P)/FAD-dependent oxidoreductase [Acidimangrovimonas pyrenivorans]|uniref:NAD(P)/FAD-dependent oxidoreductase n=1 Tax=Acidimangrovimonas pyrenivorans TaxID=2030798 RepID=A0ABV7AFP5_9RHOB
MQFPFTAEGAPEHAPTLPEATDVVVIGGGVMGIMTAWFLRAKGLRAVVCEKGRVAAEQSSRNWGWVRQQGRDPAELPIMIEANRIWQHLSAEIGEDLGFRRTGVLYLANKPGDIAGFEAWQGIAKTHGLDTKLLSRAETLAMMPGASDDWPGGCAGGLWTASDGRAEPWIAVPALARALVERGGVVAEHCAVRALDIAAGKVAGVVTERGRIACDAVVLAGGAWSSLLLRNHGVEIPQLSVISSAAATQPLPEHFLGGAADGTFAFRRRLDGGYTIAPGDFHESYIGPDAFRRLPKFIPQLKKDPFGSRYLPAAPKGFPDAWGTPRKWAADAESPFEAMRVLNPRPNMTALAKVQNAFARAFPAMGRPVLARAWAGMIDTMPDVVPVVDHVPALPGLVVATGLSGHGFGIGPGLGRVVADMVSGGAPGHDMRRFRFTRFSDGSKIEIGPTL